MEVGKKYLIIYDDHFSHPVKKIGIIKSIQGNLINLVSGETLNTNFIIRAQVLEEGNHGSGEYGR